MAGNKGIYLSRLPARDVASCEACPGGQDDAKPDYMLCLTFPFTSLTLCTRHERELLTLLLNNYVRRKTRGKTRVLLGKEDPKDSVIEVQEIFE